MRIFGYVFAIALFTGCVTARQHQDLQDQKATIEEENGKLKRSNEKLMVANDEMTAKIEDLEKDIQELAADTAALGKDLRAWATKYDELNELNEMISSKNSKLLQNAAQENMKLLEELDLVRTELQLKEDSLINLAATLQAKEANLDVISGELEAREKRVQELEALIAKQDASVNDLKNKISDALLGFKDKGLTVEQRNGKVYVSLEAKLLFPSGSTNIDADGKKALIDLAQAIQDQKDLQIVVEGHTDTDKISSSSIPRDNWELSVLRATAVVKIMTANSNIDPTILTAAGRSEYLPVDEADKAKNRRIEIILAPNLDELFEMISNE